MSCAARIPLDAPRRSPQGSHPAGVPGSPGSPRTRLLPAPSAPPKAVPACPASPHCDVPERLAGLDLMGAWWLHLGPIGRRSTPVALHPHGDPADGDRPAVSVETWPEHRPFAGCRVDYLCLPASPGVTPLVRTIDGLPAGLAPVYAVGWRDPDGPSVTLSLAGAAPSPLRWRFPSEASTGSMVAELERLEALVLGRGRGRGRPRRDASGDWRALALRDEQLQAEHPGITAAQVARILG